MDLSCSAAAANDRLDVKRTDLTEKLLDLKRENGWTWKHFCERIGGSSEVLIVGAILGQMKLTKPQAANAAELFGLSKPETAMLNETPMRGSPMPPTDPLIYRLYELVMINAQPGRPSSRRNMATASCRRSISTWRWSAYPIPRAIGSRSPCPANSCHTNITAPAATFRNTDSRRNNEVPLEGDWKT
jgi:hypothetical protein